MRTRLTRAELFAVGGAGVVLATTIAWWALAFWPAGDGATPAWLTTLRYVCFGSVDGGLPDGGGWILLVGQPIGMMAALLVGWGRDLGPGLRKAMTRPLPGAAYALLLAGVVGVGILAVRKVANAEALLGALDLPSEEMPGETYPRLDREAPGTELVAHTGERIDLDAFEGRPVILTFAFGNCGTLCPLSVHNAVRAQEQASEVERPALVVVTLDPWRDTPARLPHLADQWGIGDDGYVLGGGVEEVERVLDAWEVARDRDPVTGDITHPPVTYLLDREGRVAYASRGNTPVLVELLSRL